MVNRTLGDREWARYKKIQQENIRLKEEVKKLRRILQHANIDNKMNTKKKKLRDLQRENEDIKNKAICPFCQKELKSLHIPHMNKTLLLCSGCNHRETIQN